jgi:DNA polymerase
MIIHLDFELSGTLELRAVGADVWTSHPDTEVTFIGYAIDNEPAKALCWPYKKWDDDVPLLMAVAQGAEIHAWNAPFEWAVWNNIMADRHGYPSLSIENFHCTMAAATNVGLPMGLDEASKAINATHVKDKTGHALMKRMARPRAYEAHRFLGEVPRFWHNESPDKLNALLAYNIADVEAEREISRRIPRLTEAERRIWLMDQRMNQRGMPVDWKLLDALKAITDDELTRLNEVIRQATHGAVASVTQTAKLMGWLKGQTDAFAADELHSLARDTLAGHIAAFGDTSAGVALKARLEAAKTSTAKLKSIEAFAQIDGRARGLVQYGGAVRTLRWAGRGPQIQNFPRPMKGLDVPRVIDDILDGLDAKGIGLLYGKPLDVVSSCLRGVFKAPDGYKLVICDYHAIEAVVLAWLADFRELLAVFRRGKDVYIFTANAIGSTNRQLGKVLRLACGYGMGPDKFGVTAAKAGLILTPMQQQEAVRAFRATNRPIVQLWYAYENAAKAAISEPSKRFKVGKLEFRMADPLKPAAGALLIRKPAGGHLVYREARIEAGRITYAGVDQYTRQWKRLDTYGGKLVENVTQAVARDLLADAMVAFDRIYPDTLLTTIHDELVAQAPADRADEMFAHLQRIMSTPPHWAAGMPLSAAGAVSDRYGKA